MKQTKLAGKTWDQLFWLAQDCVGWKRCVSALCSSASEKDWLTPYTNINNHTMLMQTKLYFIHMYERDWLTWPIFTIHLTKMLLKFPICDQIARFLSSKNFIWSCVESDQCFMGKISVALELFRQSPWNFRYSSNISYSHSTQTNKQRLYLDYTVHTLWVREDQYFSYKLNTQKVWVLRDPRSMDVCSSQYFSPKWSTVKVNKYFCFFKESQHLCKVHRTNLFKIPLQPFLLLWHCVTVWNCIVGQIMSENSTVFYGWKIV